VVTVTRKDDKESLENMIRRFNRRVQQAGTIAIIRNGRYFSKPETRSARRKSAIIRNERKQQKFQQLRRGR